MTSAPHQDPVVARCPHHPRDLSGISCQHLRGQLDGGDKPEAGPDLGDMGMVLQRSEHVGEGALKLAGTRDQALTLQDVEDAKSIPRREKAMSRV